MQSIASDTSLTLTANAGSTNANIPYYDPPLDTSMVGTSAMTLTSGSGLGTLAPSPDNIAFTRGNIPYALFPATISLAMNISDISEASGTITAAAAVVFNGTGTGIAWDSGNVIRFGLLKLSNAHGSEQLDLPIPIQTQYWNGAISAFVTNDVDNCTNLILANIMLGNYQGGITTGNMPLANVGYTGPFLTGVGSLALTKPTSAPGSKGSVDICVDLGADPVGGVICPATTSAAKSYLQGIWSPGTNYNNDPVARATFGVFKGNSNFIYLRENY